LETASALKIACRKKVTKGNRITNTVLFQYEIMHPDMHYSCKDTVNYLPPYSRKPNAAKNDITAKSWITYSEHA
jgi:hypothetical protein